jgi:hypothetical protein
MGFIGVSFRRFSGKTPEISPIRASGPFARPPDECRGFRKNNPDADK